MVVHKKYRLVLAHPFEENVHGWNETSSIGIHTHYICHYIYRPQDMKNVMREIKNTKNSLRFSFEKQYNIDSALQIAEVIELEGKESVAILKTFWIRIFLRICIPFLRNIIIKNKRLRDWKYLRMREIC